MLLVVRRRAEAAQVEDEVSLLGKEGRLEGARHARRRGVLATPPRHTATGAASAAREQRRRRRREQRARRRLVEQSDRRHDPLEARAPGGGGRGAPLRGWQPAVDDRRV